MKRHIATSCLAATLLFSACDDYLDLVPKGESVLNKTEDYMGLLEDMYGYPIESEWYLCGEQSTHDLTMMQGYSAPLNSTGYYWDESFDRAGSMTAKGHEVMYSTCYDKIASYNIIIQNIDDSEGTKEDKVATKAQARILRALNYFYLINTYARPYDPATAEQERGIILRDVFNLEEEGVQGSVADAYRLIQSDIEEALPDLPHKALNTYRPDKSFGYALKAKVHLFKREIDDALKAAEEGIREAEGNGGHRLWNMNPIYDEAFFWYRDMMGMTDAMFDSWFDYGGMNYSMCMMMVRNTYFVSGYDNSEHLLFQQGLNFMAPHPSMIRKPVIDLFDPKSDLRYTFSMETMPPGRPTAEKGVIDINNMMMKWNVAGIKLSEVYLMAAECQARKGNVAEAMGYLNDLRKCRIRTKDYVALVASTKEEAMRLVREERKRELLFTVNGFFDMRRFCVEYNETLTRDLYTSNNGQLGENKTVTLRPDSHLLTYPFPISAMQNSNLVQNSK